MSSKQPSPSLPQLDLEAALQRSPVLAIIRLARATKSRSVLSALADGGVTAAEITLTTEGALGAIRQGSVEEPRLLVGAGSVRTLAQAQSAIGAGARFLVTPTLDVSVLTFASNEGIPVFCGAYTPTELETAQRAGATYLKLFPAATLGPGYIRDVRAPMPDLRIVPTGGITVGNARGWLEAGATAVAVGSGLVNDAVVSAADWGALTRRAREFVDVATVPRV